MISNSDIKRLSELKDRSGRKEQGLFIIEGKRAVVEAMTGGSLVRQVLVNAGVDADKLSDVFRVAEDSGVLIEELPATKFGKLSSTETSQGIIAVASIPDSNPDKFLAGIRPRRIATVVVLDRISDPGNLGTILRSAVWFGVDGVVIAGGSVDAYNPKVVRAAMAAVCRLEIVQDVALAVELVKMKSIGFTVVASEQGAATSYTDYEYPKRTAIVFGSEPAGISDGVLKLCDSHITIPRVGRMESLNVGVAASIVLSEIARRSPAGGQS